MSCPAPEQLSQVVYDALKRRVPRGSAAPAAAVRHVRLLASPR